MSNMPIYQALAHAFAAEGVRILATDDELLPRRRDVVDTALLCSVLLTLIF